MKRKIRLATGFALVCVVLLAAAGPARAGHLVVEVSAPDSAALGEQIVLTATVRDAATSEPVEGAELVFFVTVGFAGVNGEIELGQVTTNDLGVAVFDYEIRTLGTHTITVEGGDQAVIVSIPVTVGGQLVRPQAPRAIPGVGGWVVKLVIGTIWLIMLVVGVNVARVALARDGERPAGGGHKRLLNTGTFMTVAMILVSGGILALLFRSPNTKANFDPQGYRRTAVAYVEGAYLYPDYGLATDIAGSQAELGRALFLTKGCAGCHGVAAEGTTTAESPAFASFDWLHQVVRTGLPGMPSFTDLELSEPEINQIFAFLAQARGALGEQTATTVPAPQQGTGEQSAPAGFATAVAPILEAHCTACHGRAGGWSAGDLHSVMTSGDHAPVVIPGNPDQSLLAQKLLGTQTVGNPMPPSGSLPEEEIKAVIAWIEAGAPE